MELNTQRREKLLKKQAKHPRKAVSTLEDIEAEFRRFKSIKPHELVHVIGLLVARALAPIRDGLSKYWATTEDGAEVKWIPRNYGQEVIGSSGVTGMPGSTYSEVVGSIWENRIVGMIR
ncbi:hypothetical protein PHMEG_00039796, partial [Phytophthora megakarya]